MRRRARKQRRGELDARQEMELQIGPGGAESAFESPFVRRDAWFANRDALLRDCNEGSRPWGWWQFEALEPRRVVRTEILRDEKAGTPATIVRGDGFTRHTRRDGVVDVLEREDDYLQRLRLFTPRERTLRVWERRSRRDPEPSTNDARKHAPVGGS